MTTKEINVCAVDPNNTRRGKLFGNETSNESSKIWRKKTNSENPQVAEQN